MRNAYCQMGALIKDGGRLQHILDKGHKTKMHTYIQICGYMGSYAVWAAAMLGNNRLPMNQALAVIGLYQAMGELWNHSVNRCGCKIIEMRFPLALNSYESKYVQGNSHIAFQIWADEFRAHVRSLHDKFINFTPYVHLHSPMTQYHSTFAQSRTTEPMAHSIHHTRYHCLPAMLLTCLALCPAASALWDHFPRKFQDHGRRPVNRLDLQDIQLSTHHLRILYGCSM